MSSDRDMLMLVLARTSLLQQLLRVLFRDRLAVEDNPADAALVLADEIKDFFQKKMPAGPELMLMQKVTDDFFDVLAFDLKNPENPKGRRKS